MSRQKRPGDGDLQRNAADPDQVQYAGRKVQDRAQRVLTAFAVVLAQSEGRVVLDACLGMCRMYDSMTGLTGDELAMAIGRREAGLAIDAVCRQADEDNLALAAQERRAYERREALDHEASRTPRATLEELLTE